MACSSRRVKRPTSIAIASAASAVSASAAKASRLMMGCSGSAAGVCIG
jgi:hypothetical protein